MSSSPFGQVGELTILTSRVGKPAVKASELVALVVVGTPPSRYIQSSELVGIVSYQKGKVVAHVSEIVALVSYTVGGTERFNSRAWGFTLDQHPFYVLHLGSEGTFVFDALTSQWAEWGTEGYVGWNAENGVEWNNQVYYGDNEGPTLWRMDPESFLDDDFRTITRIVTGGIPATGRQTIRTGMFVLSMTKQSDIDTLSDPYVKLSISDDGGKTFRDLNVLTFDDSETQDLSWRSLGVIKAPGRVFRIEDQGGLVTISGADLTVDGE